MSLLGGIKSQHRGQLRLRHIAPILLSIFLITIVSSFSSAQVLIVELSDVHSAYDRLPNFLRSFSELRENYLKTEPQGKVVVIVNGDYTGLSAWTIEGGWLGIKALEHISKQAQVLFVMGNHDAFDWSTAEDGNRLMAQQLQRMSMLGIHVMGSNFDYDRVTDALVEKKFDFTPASGKTIRFVGLGLPQFFQKSNWTEDPYAPVILRVKRSQPIMRDAVEAAAKDRIPSLILFQHDSQTDVVRRIRRLKVPEGLSLPVVFAAHDHLLAQDQVGQTHIVDSRSNYDFTAVKLDRKNQVKDIKFYDQAAQEKMARAYLLRKSAKPEFHDSSQEIFLRSAERYVEKLKIQNQEIVTDTGGFTDFKYSLKEGPRPLGTALAETLRAWATAQMVTLNPSANSLPVIAMYNSSSYRRDDAIPAGEIDRSVVSSFYPFPGRVLMFQTTYQTVQKLFSDLRQWRLGEDGKYTPQLSANLYETENFQLVEADTQIPLTDKPNQQVILVLDSWLSQNGYKIDSFDQFLKTHSALAAYPHKDIMQEYVAKVLPRFSPPARSMTKLNPALAALAPNFASKLKLQSVRCEQVHRIF